MLTFYLVWSPTGHYPPTRRHPDLPTAQGEAERLASANPGHEFFVLRAGTRSFVQPITERLMQPAQNQAPNAEVSDDDIPF